MAALQAVFVDRDGTIGGNGHFIHPRDFRPFPSSLRAIEMAKQAGLFVFAFTNQHRIARGQATINEFEEEFRRFGLDDSYICPHEPQDGCLCHKPSPGLLLQAARNFSLDLTKCVVVGDVGSTDMLAAHAVGAMSVLVRTGWGEQSLGAFRPTWATVEPDYVANDLFDAMEWITTSRKPEGTT